ncbi:DUF4349 domain-containing protein [Nonomuraea sp. NPDC004354]
MSRIRYGMALTAACAVLVLSGCGGGNSAARNDSGGTAPAAAPAAQAETAGTGRSTVSGESAKKVTIAPEQRSIIYVSEMTVRAGDVTKAAEQAKQLVTAAGGYLSSEESDAFDGGDGSSTLVFKIPPAAYQGLLDRMGKLLGKRESLRQNTTDVTEEVADVASRLKSAEQALAAMRTLLTRADTVGQVIEVEREIATREAELESLQARQKALAAQVSTATLTLRLIGPVTPVAEPSEEPAGFLGGLRAGWSALVGFVQIALTVVGVLLPWLVAMLPVAVVILLLVRRGRARRPVSRTGPAAPPVPAAHGGPRDPQASGERPHHPRPGDDQPPAQQAQADPRPDDAPAQPNPRRPRTGDAPPPP